MREAASRGAWSRAGAALVATTTVIVLWTGGTPIAEGQRLVAGPDSAFSRVQYADSSISLNDRCIVSEKRLSRKIRPVYVNGQPIGFC